jgi:hypothetical protein
MSDLLDKLGLSDKIRLELPVSRAQLIAAIESNIDPPSFPFFDTYAKGHKLYRGRITSEGFDILRTHQRHAKKIGTRAIGKFISHGDHLIIDIQLTAFHPLQIPFLVLGILVYVLTFWAIVTDRTENNAPWMIPALFAHAAIMFGVPYWIVKSALRESKGEIDKNIRLMLRMQFENLKI